MGRRKRSEEPPAPLLHTSIEVFKDPINGFGGIQSDYGHFNVPRVINGQVHFRKYRITAELVEETPEVLFERLRELWRAAYNTHHTVPLQEAARSIGFELDPKERGADARKEVVNPLGRKPYST